MVYLNRDCVDVGTENCPCILAESGDCLVCTRLSGKQNCDCSWSGLCIYNEFCHNGKRILNKREDIPVQIIERKYYGQEYMLLTIKATGNLLLKGGMPGAFLMARSASTDSIYNMPLSVMKVDLEKKQIKLLVRILSAKTKGLMNTDELMVRGIYKNGLLGNGLKTLEKTGKWLIISRGAAFVSGINMIEWSESRASVDFIVDLNDECDSVVEEYVKGRATIIRRSLDSIIECGEKSISEISQYSHVILLMSDYYREAMIGKLNIPNEKLIYSNNYHICCGEGVCGACSIVEADGKTKKMCKARYETLIML